MGDFKGEIGILPLQIEHPSESFLLLVLIQNGVVVARLKAMVPLPKHIPFNHTQHPNAQKHSHRIVKYIGRQVPDAGITVQTGG